VLSSAKAFQLCTARAIFSSIFIIVIIIITFFLGVLLFYSALGQFMMVFVSPLGFLLWSHGGCRESGTDVGL
jgi:hypothetical protein